MGEVGSEFKQAGSRVYVLHSPPYCPKNCSKQHLCPAPCCTHRCLQEPLGPLCLSKCPIWFTPDLASKHQLLSQAAGTI